MKKKFPSDYKIYPKTWVYPQEKGKILAHIKKKSALLLKEKGQKPIALISAEQLEHLPQRPALVQQVIQKPLTLKKVQYEHTYLVLMTRLKPLTIYLYKEPIIKSKSRQVSQADFMELLKDASDDQ